MLASAATMALELIDNDVTMTSRLKTVSEALHAALSDVEGYAAGSYSCCAERSGLKEG